MKTVHGEIEIDFDEVVEVLDRIDPYTAEVLLQGCGSDGNMYRACGTRCCGEIELAEYPEIELV